MPDIKQLLIGLAACPEDRWLFSQLKFNGVLFQCNPSRAGNNLGKNSASTAKTVFLLKVLEKGQVQRTIVEMSEYMIA
jgi:hypothetical protein